MQNWRGVGIEAINERGSFEEQSKEISQHLVSSQTHPNPVIPGLRSDQNSVIDIQEGDHEDSKDEQNYVTDN